MLKAHIPGGEWTQTEFGEVATFEGLPTNAAIDVEVDGVLHNLTFLFVPPEKGCTVSFFMKGENVSYVATNEVLLNEDGSRPKVVKDEAGSDAPSEQ